MKTIIRFAICFILPVILLWRWDDTGNYHNGLPSLLTITSQSPCKYDKSTTITNALPDSISCVEYAFNASTGILNLTHINAGFNCCPGEIYCTYEVSPDTLIIKEHETSAQCTCECLFDLEMEISNVHSGFYIVKFVEPYCGSQDLLIFPVQLANQPTGSFRVKRDQYPWNLGLFWKISRKVYLAIHW